MSVSNEWFDDRFAEARLMAIFRGMGAERTLQLANAAWDLGIDAVEVPLQTAEDELALRAIAAAASERGLVVGAGTIVAVDQVARAADAGAAFLVSPGLDAAVVRAAEDAGLPILPGVATPTEVQLAQSLGLNWVKAFPAQWLGPGWFKHLRGPFPQVRFVATGGLNADNAEEFLAAGVRVAAVGSALEDPQQLPRLAQLAR